MNIAQLRRQLDAQYERYNRPEFIKNDPIQIPHRFTQRQDIEIAALFAALLAWGLRAGRRPVRLAALALVGLASAKVFVVDMADLDGLWRVLSFLGLGLSLIGLSALYRRVVTATPPGTPGAAAPPR